MTITDCGIVLEIDSLSLLVIYLFSYQNCKSNN